MPVGEIVPPRLSLGNSIRPQSLDASLQSSAVGAVAPRPRQATKSILDSCSHATFWPPLTCPCARPVPVLELHQRLIRLVALEYVAGHSSSSRVKLKPIPSPYLCSDIRIR